MPYSFALVSNTSNSYDTLKLNFAPFSAYTLSITKTADFLNDLFNLVKSLVTI